MEINQLAVNAIRVISSEAIDKANSGHPGLPLGSATLGYTLFNQFLNFNPKNAKFDNRDRFVLSAGHGSMLNYTLLHLFGYDLPMTELANFRQAESKTPGHPEYGHTVGIEITTGPLGQGIANAVGMAIAETHLAEKFNTEEYKVVDHYTYALCGDGCMQEGIEAEAASLAGTLKLGKLIVIYDKNNITIEGSIDTAFTEDVGARHIAQGWQVLHVQDGNNIAEIAKALEEAKAETTKPTLIIARTIIGFGAPKQGTPAVHGAPLGTAGTQALKANLEYDYPPFTIPTEVYENVTNVAIAKGATLESNWNAMFEAYAQANPELANQYKMFMNGEICPLVDHKELLEFAKPDATRNTSFTVLNKLSGLIPNLMGGSADLAPSNKSNMVDRQYYSPENKLGTNMHFGIREHAMSAICNGMAVHGGLNVYCSTFFVFSDYMKNAMRLSALMNLNVTYILTHDSIGVGEDGPTHQPVEQLVGLRNIPNMKVFRPADGKETAYAWISALTGNGPTCLVLTRQNLPQYENATELALNGGYILADSTKATPDALLMASGSEVELIMQAKAKLAEEGIDARVISMPCLELFDKQTAEYKEQVMPNAVRARVAVETASTASWYKYVGLDGKVIGMDTFGASAPFDYLLEKFNFTVENVVAQVKATMAK